MIYDNFNEAIFKLVSPDSDVLDIGCDTGRLAKQLRDRKNCRVTGIEISAESAEIAKQNCDTLICADAFNALPKLGQKYDVVVLADVLEHMPKPEKLLELVNKRVKQTGRVIVCIPNIAFIQNRLEHLAGKFDYAEWGIMDKTHLRFFTKKTATSLFQKSGFEVKEIRSYNPVSRKFRILDPLSRIMPGLFSIEYVFVLTPTPDKNSTKQT